MTPLMPADTLLEERLDRLEAHNRTLRVQLREQSQSIEKLSLEVARLERAVLSRTTEIMVALVELRAHWVDVATDAPELPLRGSPIG
jgi:hypothetical protein